MFCPKRSYQFTITWPGCTIRKNDPLRAALMIAEGRDVDECNANGGALGVILNKFRFADGQANQSIDYNKEDTLTFEILGIPDK